MPSPSVSPRRTRPILSEDESLCGLRRRGPESSRTVASHTRGYSAAQARSCRVGSLRVPGTRGHGTTGRRPGRPAAPRRRFRSPRGIRPSGPYRWPHPASSTGYRRPTGRYRANEYGRRMATSSRSLTCWSGRWKCGRNRPDCATSETTSTVQSMGSRELRRKVRSPATRSRARSRSIRLPRGNKSRPQAPRWTPVTQSSLKPAAPRRRVSSSTSGKGRLRLRPRVSGTMQYRAVLVASRLDPQWDSRASPKARPEAQGLGGAFRPGTLRSFDPKHTTQTDLCVVGHDPDNSGKCGHTVSAAGRVASCRHDAAGRVEPMDPPDCPPRRLVRRRGDRAGIHDHDVRALRRRRRSPVALEVPLDGERVALIGSTAEREDGVGHGVPRTRRFRVSATGAGGL